MISPDRWARLEKLFGDLYEKPVGVRERALAAVEDADLRAEVAELLSTHEGLTSREPHFLTGLDSALANSLLDRSRAPAEDPATIGRYRIVRRLARGGMGVVYQAHDPRLNRPVALKLLPPYLSADPAAVCRLGEEARAASALDHTHIETVYEIDETADGRGFIAMAYYDGETLRERMGRGPVSVESAIDVGVQLAEGLGAAHRGGIVHRDIKPENILLTKDGVLKIVDFGVAKVMKEGLASAGLPLGTAAYMSPEQTRGEALDHRTDLWSAGVVLYEMLAGARPFGGEGEALIHAIRQDAPAPLSASRAEVPPALADLVKRCLRKDREERPDSAEALANGLRAAASGGFGSSGVLPGPARRVRRRWARIAVAVLVPAVVLTGLLVRGGAEVSPPAEGEAAAPGIAVLPFEVRGADQALLGDGMVDLLSINIDGTPGLRAIDSRTVLAQWGQAVREGGRPDLESALDVARATGARYAVTGGVVSTGSDIRLTARIHSLADGARLASVQVEGSPDSLFVLVDRLSIGVLAAVWEGQEKPDREVDLSRITTTSLAALKAYLAGESLLRRADFPGAAAAYEEAVAADSTFAFALFHLGLAAGWNGDEPLQDASYRRALRHAARLPERETLLLRATLVANARGTIPLADGIGLLEEVARKYPDDADGWYFLGDRYFHDGEKLLVSKDESERAFRKVVALDPGYAAAWIHLVHNAFIHRPDSARAARVVELYHGLAPQSPSDEMNQIAFGIAFGDSARRTGALEALDTLPLGRREELVEAYLDHPRFWNVQRAVLERTPRPDTSVGGRMRVQLFATNLSQGRIRDALANLEDPLSLPFRSVGLYRIHSAGLPVPAAVLEAALTLPAADSLPYDPQSFLTLFYGGALAADRGRWKDHASSVEHLRARAEWYLSQGDSARTRFMRGSAAALQGYGMWLRGDAAGALPVLREAQRQATWSGSVSADMVNETVRWWLGDLLLQMGRPRDAAVYFASSGHEPLVAARLGRSYEQIGERDRAREAYSLLATTWSHADPELQPLARAAGAAAQRLMPPTRE